MLRGFKRNDPTPVYVFLAVLVITLVFGYLLSGPNKEDFLKFHSLQDKARSIEQIAINIEQKQEKITELQKKLQTQLPKKEAIDAVRKLGIYSALFESSVRHYNEKVDLYTQEATQLPQVLSDSLKIFIKK